MNDDDVMVWSGRFSLEELPDGNRSTGVFSPRDSYAFYSHDAECVVFRKLRDSQGYCTDSECVQDLPGPQGAGFGANNLMMIVTLWAVLAIAMFMLRPNSMRSRTDPMGKPGPRSGGDAPEPPAPSAH